MNIFLPRGIRNNNPGNIRLSKIKWLGQKQEALSDNVFVEFTSALYGLRALMVLLLNYYSKYGLDSVEAIINRYAPPCENATDAYIYYVSKMLNVKRRDKIDMKDISTLILITKAIVGYEQGKSFYEEYEFWYSDKIYKDAADLAFK